MNNLDILDMKGQKVDTNKVEAKEQKLAEKYIEEDDVVLELGARYGSVSCVINNKLKNKKKQVVVEPDKRVWKALERNKNANNCDFSIVKGFISNKKLDLTNLDNWIDGYGATFVENEESEIPSYSLEEIKNNYKINFNVLVADCEGFLETFFDENPDLYKELRMVIFEKDYPDKCNYQKIRKNLHEHNFTEVLMGKQNVYIKK